MALQAVDTHLTDGDQLVIRITDDCPHSPGGRELVGGYLTKI